MKLETFFENFELLTDAPNAAAKLREIVLQLAVSGKLVPQHPDDEPASVLLKTVQLEKARLIKKEKIRDSESFEQTDYEYASPQGWTWTKLGEFIELVSGQHLGQEEQNEKGEGLPYLTGPADFGEINPVATRWTTTSKSVAKRDDILITVKGAGVGKTNILGLEEAAIGRQLMAIRPILVDHEYIYRLILSAYEKFQSLSIGSTVPGIGRKDILNFLVNLPPLAEQKRIVEKCDRLLILCDEIEKRQQQRQESLLKMNQGAISQLLTAQNSDDFHHHWQRICNNFDLLYSIPETIPKLRQAILQLAVQGKLLQQDQEDESNFNEITSSVEVGEDLPRLPENWLYLTVNQACSHIIDCPHSTPKFIDQGYFCIDTNCISQGRIIFDKARYVSEETFIQRTKRLLPEEGDILFSREGTIGISAIVPKNVKLCLGQRMMMYRVHKFLDSSYFLTFLASPFFQDQINSKTTGTAAKHVNIGDIRKMLVIIPPLAEQKRIVAKVDSLLSLCDTLEAKLKAARDSSATLMEVAARQVLAV